MSGSAEGVGRATGLSGVVGAAAPWFAAEALVFDRYWDSSSRSLDSDLGWLRRQAYKELVDGALARIASVDAGLDHASDPHVRQRLQDDLVGAAEELDHFGRFADAHEQLGGGRVEVSALRADGNWEANESLRRVRARHAETHPIVGRLAATFTEGGCSTLYAAGAARAGHGPEDDVIAAACSAVFADEIRHMRGALADVPAGWTESDWKLLASLVVEQCRARVDMRDEQFGHPLTRADRALIETGRIEPIAEVSTRFGLDADQGTATISA